ncbi:unnamed protein product [Ectocarpus sp. 4 AP-2014]
MPCADGELCKQPDVELRAPRGHDCHGGCGGRLHGMCGEVEVLDGIEMHRTCHACASKNMQAPPPVPNPPKRKEAEGGVLPPSGVQKKPRAAGASGTRMRLNFGQKLEVLNLSDQGVGSAELARRFKCGTAAIGTIKRNRASLEADAAASSRSTASKSAKGGDFPKVEQLVSELVEEARRVPLPVTRATIMSFGVAAKNKMLAAESTTAGDKKRLEDFTANERWAKNFISRNGMVSTVLHGEAGSVDDEAIAEGLGKIREACKKFGMENIFNVDETGIFYRLMPNRTYLSTEESRKSARGTKGIYMCTNANGTAKVPMAIIMKSKNPRCFGKQKRSPIKYFSQANAWSDGATFKKWWLEEFILFIRKWTHQPVLLLMDGCASLDLLVDPTGQITTMVYPPNCTSKHQPMDMGIIAATKRHYRKRLLRLRVSTMSVTSTLCAQAKARKMTSGTMRLAEGHPAHVLDAAELLEAEWDDLTESSIASNR